jgi:hypothetical protein
MLALGMISDRLLDGHSLTRTTIAVTEGFSPALAVMA